MVESEQDIQKAPHNTFPAQADCITQILFTMNLTTFQTTLIKYMFNVHQIQVNTVPLLDFCVHHLPSNQSTYNYTRRVRRLNSDTVCSFYAKNSFSPQNVFFFTCKWLCFLCLCSYTRSSELHYTIKYLPWLKKVKILWVKNPHLLSCIPSCIISHICSLLRGPSNLSSAMIATFKIY